MFAECKRIGLPAYSIQMAEEAVSCEPSSVWFPWKTGKIANSSVFDWHQTQQGARISVVFPADNNREHWTDSQGNYLPISGNHSGS